MPAWGWLMMGLGIFFSRADRRVQRSGTEFQRGRSVSEL
jgi:hypothetical protein